MFSFNFHELEYSLNELAMIIFFHFKVTLEKMDALVTEAAFLPRKLGFAPKNEDIYASDDQRKAAR